MKNKMTMKEFKEKYEEAAMKVLENPVEGLKGEEKVSAKTQITIILTGMLYSTN